MRDKSIDKENNSGSSSSGSHNQRQRSSSVDSVEGDLLHSSNDQLRGGRQSQHQHSSQMHEDTTSSVSTTTTTKRGMKWAIADQIYGKFDRDALIRLIDVIVVPLYSRVWQLAKLGEVCIPIYMCCACMYKSMVNGDRLLSSYFVHKNQFCSSWARK